MILDSCAQYVTNVVDRERQAETDLIQRTNPLRSIVLRLVNGKATVDAECAKEVSIFVELIFRTVRIEVVANDPGPN